MGEPMEVTKDQPIVVKIFTSSHGRPGRHLIQGLEKVFCQNSFMTFPSINFKPGRLVNYRLYNEVKRDFFRIPIGEQRLTIIILGDNDLRVDLDQGMRRVSNYYKEIVKIYENSKHLLLLLGTLPSPISQKFTDRYSLKNDFRIQNLVEEQNSDHICFLKTQTLFDRVGVPQKAFFEKDLTHLRPIGAEVLAKAVHDKALEMTTNCILNHIH